VRGRERVERTHHDAIVRVSAAILYKDLGDYNRFSKICHTGKLVLDMILFPRVLEMGSDLLQVMI
jgi:hypothetical protein